jgi:hypothetical protein
MKKKFLEIGGLDRTIYLGDLDEAIYKISFCLNTIEKSNKFNEGQDWNTSIIHGERPTNEELLGALVNAEQVLKKIKEDLEREEKIEEKIEEEMEIS